MTKNLIWNILNDTQLYFRRIIIIIAGYFLKIPEKFLSKNITPQDRKCIYTPSTCTLKECYVYLVAFKELTSKFTV
jgi:hypothetical protein